jgi:hypothetical protein
MMIEQDYPDLAYRLGLTRKQREEIRRVLPSARTERQRTRISDEDAERLISAVAMAALAGVAVIIVLRLLLSGAAIPGPAIPGA